MGKRILDGYKTRIKFTTLDGSGSVQFEERSVKPVGLVAGDPIDVTSMSTADFRRFIAPKLKDLAEAQVTTYGASPVPLNLINQLGKIEITFPDDSKVEFYGFIRDVEVNEITEGDAITSTVTFVASNISGFDANGAPIEATDVDVLKYTPAA